MTEKEKILIADNEESIRRSLDAIIQHKYDDKYAILTACDGEEEVKAYKENSSDIFIILTDNEMPKMDGLEAALEIKKEAKLKGKNIPIVLMSGRAVLLENKFKDGKYP